MVTAPSGSSESLVLDRYAAAQDGKGVQCRTLTVAPSSLNGACFYTSLIPKRLEHWSSFMFVDINGSVEGLAMWSAPLAWTEQCARGKTVPCSRSLSSETFLWQPKWQQVTPFPVGRQRSTTVVGTVRQDVWRAVSALRLQEKRQASFAVGICFKQLIFADS